VQGAPSPEIAAAYAGPLLVIPRSGDVIIRSETIAPGGCGLAASLAEVTFAPDGTCLIARPCST